MGFKKLYSTLKGLFKSKRKVPQPKIFTAKLDEHFFGVAGMSCMIQIGKLRYQESAMKDTLIVHAYFCGESMKRTQNDPFNREWLYQQYFEELVRLKSLGYTKLMAVVPAGRKQGLSMLLEQGGFIKDQEVFTLDIGGNNGS